MPGALLHRLLPALSTPALRVSVCLLAGDPRNEEEAVQSGLRKWADGRNATWEVLMGAMKQGGIAVQDIDKLKEELKEGLQCEYMHLHLLPMCSC